MRLGIDLDGVVAAFNAGWIALHNAEFGGSLHPEMVTMWDGLHELAGFADMGEFWRWAQGSGERPSVFRHLEPIPGALETLRELDTAGHDVVILTSKPRWAVPDTLHWLADQRVPTTEVHVVDRKHSIECDVYLDDAPYVLPALVRHRPTATVCRFVRPWNDPVPGAVDVGDWPDFREIVLARAAGT